MEVDEPAAEFQDWSGRWNHLKKLLERRGPFSPSTFVPSSGIILSILNSIISFFFFEEMSFREVIVFILQRC